MKRLFLTSLLVCASIFSSAHAGQFFQDFSASSVGATSFGDGSTLASTHLGTAASVQDTTFRELQLTASGTANTRSAFLLPDLDPGAPVYGFSAKWNTQIYRASTNDADGFSFNFGQLASLNLINASYFQESGYPTGLCFSVQTYKDNNPGFYLRLNGNVIASATNNPTTQWGITNDTRHFFEVDWLYVNGLTVRMDGQTIFSNVMTVGFIPRAGDQFVWAARTGVLTEQVRLDNIVVATGGTLSQVPMASQYYKSGENAGNNETADKAFDGQNTTKWLTFANNGFVGATASSSPAILAYALTSANDVPARDPKIWSMEGSNNNGTNWSGLGIGSGNFASRFETRGWVATNANSFNAFRLNVQANNGDADLQLAELRLYQFNAFTLPWTETSAGDRRWWSIASSASGTNLLAGTITTDNLWHSTNAGVSWQRLPASPVKQWSCVGSSSNGAVLLAGAYGDDVFFSTNAGATWTDAGAFGHSGWLGAAVSANGKVFIIGGYFPDLSYISTNSGATWFSGPSVAWWQVAASVDGHTLVGASDDGSYYSTNFGVTWSSASIPGTSKGAACSADGTKFGFSGFNNGVFISTNSGANWTQTSLPNSSWATFSASADFKTLIVGQEIRFPNSAAVMVSQDGGAHWSQANVPFANWYGSAISADGSKLYAAAETFNSPGGIWKFFYPPTQLPPVPITVAATSVVLHNATLNGRVIGNYLQTAAWFEWGTTTNYGNSTAPQNTGIVETGYSSAINGLQPEVTYHFRAAATNFLGVSYGADAAFTTPALNSVFGLTIPADPVVATSGNSPGGQGASSAIDDTVASKYLNLDKTNTGFTVFPSITNRPVRALTLISAEDAPERDPSSFELYGSPDGTNFTLIASNAIPIFSNRNAIQTFPINNPNSYLAYKILFPTVVDPTNANSMQIAEVEFLPYDEITSTNDTVTLLLPAGATASDGATNSLLDHMVGFDTNKLAVSSDSSNVVLIVTPASGSSVVKGLELIGGNNDQDYPQGEPSTVKLEGSNDGTNFVMLASVNPASPTSNKQIQRFPLFGNASGYAKYRVTLGPPQSLDILEIGEVRLFGSASLPVLTIASTGNQVTLRWLDVPGFFLEYKTDLTSTQWFTNNSAVLSNGINSVSLPVDSQTKFFRLFKP